MENIELKYVQVTFDKEPPQAIGTKIKIIGEIDDKIENLEYKFIVGRSGIWKTIKDFSDDNTCLWEPKAKGEYIVMVQARENNGKKSLDYLAKEDYIIEEEIRKIEDKEIESKEIEGKEIESEEIKNAEIENINFKEVEQVGEEVALDIQDKNDETKLKLIEGVNLDKQELTIGEKCTISVDSKMKKNILYRFYVKRYNDWDIVRDYETDNILKYTATQIGEKEFLIQCKEI